MSETGDQFAGASERSTKHSPRVDEELEHEMQRRSTVEPSAEGDPDVDANPSGTLVGGTTGRHGRRRRGRALRAGPLAGPGGLPEQRVRTWSRQPVTTVRPTPSSPNCATLPDGETYERVGDVVRALGYATET